MTTSRGLLHVFGQWRSAERSLASAAAMRSYGYTMPDGLLTGAELARKSGAEIREQTEVTSLDRAGRQVRAVLSGRDALPAKTVVLAGGASSSTLLRPLGVTLPLIAWRPSTSRRPPSIPKSRPPRWSA
jgi:glycine/D-amino acid oxidase-like deaminating enzyme